MPDAWEEAHGLDPNDARDGSALSPNRYTNMENYLNELPGDPVVGAVKVSAISPPQP